MRASVCMAAYKRPDLLRRTLESIYRQTVPFEFETIVCDDGGGLPEQLLKDFPQVRWMAITREGGHRNPAHARNATYRAARGEVVICQSEEVMHVTDNTIERLVNDLEQGTCLFATVYDLDSNNTPVSVMCGKRRRPVRPLFFLGSLYRRDLYTVGGNDTEFIHLGMEDRWLGECLVNGLHLRPVYMDDVIGHHQYHPPLVGDIGNNRHILTRKQIRAKRTGIWKSRGGPWPYHPNGEHRRGINPFSRPAIEVGTHLPLLIQVVSHTTGPILELGTGLYSTPYLHWACAPTKRRLDSYESAHNFMTFAEAFSSDYHHVQLVTYWDDIDLSREWEVAFVDHTPAQQRVFDISRLTHVPYVVVHDTTTLTRRHDRQYNYDVIRPLFRYSFERIDNMYGTTVFSNVHDVSRLMENGWHA